ncbi:MAG: amino acid transporter [Gammaproteobacteria bacterium HGW-Gammaproteobacteria-4]|nr:MAG: amino acid transporter [Gammaproteobacteria bacterium HGW-Gammaproteobacteria-4]
MSRSTANAPTLIRVVSRWQIVGLSINDVIGSGIYLLPAAAAALLGPASLWAVLLAGVAVSLLVLCYAQASSYFDQAGGAYLYTREAFGDFIGFEVGWMAWLTRIASIAALANGLALAMAALWPAMATGPTRIAVIVLGIAVVTWINVVGVRSGARMAVILTLAKLLPLLVFVIVGVFHMDWANLSGAAVPERTDLAEAALLLLFAYAGFENTPAAAGEYKNPKRDIPFAMLTMIAVVTFTYVAIQAVALGTLPGLATSTSPLADAAGGFAGPGAVMLLTLGAVVSILGNMGNSVLMGPRYLYALAVDGYGPALFARVHPRWHTPAAAIAIPAALALALALSGSFVQLALLSVIARLATYIGTAASLLVLQKRHAARPGALILPGGRLIPLLALAISLILLSATTVANLLAGAAAIAVGALIFRFRRR